LNILPLKRNYENFSGKTGRVDILLKKLNTDLDYGAKEEWKNLEAHLKSLDASIPESDFADMCARIGTNAVGRAFSTSQQIETPLPAIINHKAVVQLLESHELIAPIKSTEKAKKGRKAKGQMPNPKSKQSSSQPTMRAAPKRPRAGKFFVDSFRLYPLSQAGPKILSVFSKTQHNPFQARILQPHGWSHKKSALLPIFRHPRKWTNRYKARRLNDKESTRTNSMFCQVMKLHVVRTIIAIWRISRRCL
jgi:hypothetical protein